MNTVPSFLKAVSLWLLLFAIMALPNRSMALPPVGNIVPIIPGDTRIGDTLLTTGMLWSGANDYVSCNVVNVSGKDIVVGISFVNSFVHSRVVDYLTMTLHPYDASGLVFRYDGVGYCQFNFSGPPNAIRANGALIEADEFGLTTKGFRLVTDAR
jgi:hypothetical protein